MFKSQGSLREIDMKEIKISPIHVCPRCKSIDFDTTRISGLLSIYCMNCFLFFKELEVPLTNNNNNH